MAPIEVPASVSFAALDITRVQKHDFVTCRSEGEFWREARLLAETGILKLRHLEHPAPTLF